MDLDIWYCDKCGSFVVFVSDAMQGKDYVPIDIKEVITKERVQNWDLYFAMRDREFDEFSDQYGGKRPLDALLEYQNVYRCRVSPDKSKILVFGGDVKSPCLFERRERRNAL